MKKKISIIVCILTLSFVAVAQVKVKNLLTENLTNPIGLDITQPRFSWQLASDKRNISQTAYEIKVSDGKLSIWHNMKHLNRRCKAIGCKFQSGKLNHTDT